jgi:hypothetical protein
MDVDCFALLNDVAEPSFIVDQGATVIWRNDYASELFGQDSFAASEAIAGLFKCVHKRFLPAPCSSAPFCQHCVARSVVDRCLRENRDFAQDACLSINDDAPFTVESTLVTKPIGDDDCTLAIVTLLNARRVKLGSAFHSRCSQCKVEGSERHHWLHVENFLHGVEYTSEAEITARKRLSAHHADLTYCL